MKRLFTAGLVMLTAAPVVFAKDVKIATVDDAIAAYFHTVELERDSSSWLRYMPASVNGKDTLMLIDSGAHKSCFDVGVASRAGIKLKKSSARVSGIKGSSSYFSGVVDSVKIGGAMELSRGPQLFLDMGTGKSLEFEGRKSICGGLLGADILRQVDLSIDFPKNRVLLQKTPISDGLWGLLKQTGYTKIDLIATKSAVYIPVKLGDRDGYFQVDTGSSQMVVFDNFTKGKNYPPMNHNADLQGVGGEKTAARFVTVDDFSIPGRRLSAPMLVIHAGAISMINKKPVMGIFGIPIIDHMKMIINLKRLQVYLPKRSK